jgi:ABC-2 type transport system permease protein
MRTRQFLALSRRSILGTLRQPEMIFPSLFFPLLFAALNTASFARSTQLPGFPRVHSFLDFMVAGTIIQGVLFGATSGGNDMAVDIQDGFFDRLMASPVSRPLVLTARLAGASVLGAAQAVIFTVILVLFGAHVQGGAPAIAVLVLVGALLALGVGGMAVTLALKTGSAEAVQGAFPLFFIFLFLSSIFFPRSLMHGAFKAVAGANPLSWMVEGLRHQVLVGFDLASAARAAFVGVALSVGSIGLATMALRARVAPE